MSEEHCCHKSIDTKKLAVSATLHCLTGCVIGESLGLMIGVTLGLNALSIIILATTLAFMTGFGLTLLPAFQQGLNISETFQSVWLGEVLSIGTMEIVMNTVDYHLGGMTAGSVLTWIFWFSLIVSVIAGFLAAYPVNYWMLKNNIKQPCH